MAIVEVNDIKPVIETGRAISNMVNPPRSEDTFAKIERIISGINHLADTYFLVKNKNDSPIGDRPIIEQNGDKINYQPPPTKILEKEVSNPLNEKLLQFISEHLAEMATENPEMLLGEAIEKIPLTVSQVISLISLLKNS